MIGVVNCDVKSSVVISGSAVMLSVGIPRPKPISGGELKLERRDSTALSNGEQ